MKSHNRTPIKGTVAPLNERLMLRIRSEFDQRGDFEHLKEREQHSSVPAGVQHDADAPESQRAIPEKVDRVIVATRDAFAQFARFN